MYSFALLFCIILATVITYFIIPVLKSKVSAEEQAEMIKWVRIAVAAAEQLFKGTGRGEEKKAYVLEWLESRGVRLDASAKDAMIESEVYALNVGKNTSDTDSKATSAAE